MLGPKIEIEYERKGVTHKIVLGPPVDEEKTVATMTHWMNNNRNRLFMAAPGGEVISAEKEWLTKITTDETKYVWMVYFDGTLVGDIGLHDVNRVHGNAELGILIGEKEFWGQGIAPVIEAAISDFSFKNLMSNGLHKIYAYVLEGNGRSQKALEKAGFRMVGTFKDEVFRNGKWSDCWCGELIARKWLRNRKRILKSLGVKSLNCFPGCEDVGIKAELF
jgi:RimJ/RimL family protein N-acetyltransferase